MVHTQTCSPVSKLLYCCQLSQVNLNEKLLENRPKREVKPTAVLTTPVHEPVRRQASKTKLGPQLRYCSQILRDFTQSKKLYLMAWPFLEPVDWKVCVCIAASTCRCSFDPEMGV